MEPEYFLPLFGWEAGVPSAVPTRESVLGGEYRGENWDVLPYESWMNPGLVYVPQNFSRVSSQDVTSFGEAGEMMTAPVLLSVSPAASVWW